MISFIDMKLNTNHLSIVAIGNFNPAILTTEFLNEVCELDLGEPTHQTPTEIPVHKQFKFKNLDIDAVLTRLIIKENGPEDIYVSDILRIFDTIYKKLPHTPLKFVGVNINCDLIKDNNDKTDTLALLLSNPDTLLKFYEVDEISVTESFLKVKGKKEWTSSNYHISNVKDLTRLIQVGKKINSYNINYNCEAGPLHHDKTKLNLLIDSYKEFCDEFFNFIKYLET